MNKNVETARMTWYSFFLMMLAFLVYSSTGIFSKQASMEEFLSIEYVIRFALVILAMCIYAILWQIILKSRPLSQAYLFKSVTVVFSLLFAWSIFHEAVTMKNLVGCGFIIAGIILNSWQKAA